MKVINCYYPNKRIKDVASDSYVDMHEPDYSKLVIVSELEQNRQTGQLEVFDQNKIINNMGNILDYFKVNDKPDNLVLERQKIWDDSEKNRTVVFIHLTKAMAL